MKVDCFGPHLTLLHANAERGRASERFRDVSVGSYVPTCRYRYMTVPLPSQVAFEIIVLNSLRPSDLRYHAWMTCRPVAPHPPDKRIQRHGLWLCDATGAQPRTMRLPGGWPRGPFSLLPIAALRLGRSSKNATRTVCGGSLRLRLLFLSSNSKDYVHRYSTAPLTVPLYPKSSFHNPLTR